MKKIILLIFIPLSFLFAQPQNIPWIDGRSKAENLTIKLVTFGVGDDIPAWWGHAGLIVEDREYLQSRIYNFGLYSFEDGFLYRFAMGRLIFSAGDFSVPGYLAFYRRLDRDIRIATLQLPDDSKLVLAQKLAESVLPENKKYLYDHYYDNCSTRLRDLLDEATNGALRKQTDKPARMTLRDHTKRYVGHNAFMNLLLMYLMSDVIDRPIRQWDEMFLPDELEYQIRALSYPDSTGRPVKLVSDYLVLYQSQRDPVPDQPVNNWWTLILSGLALGLLAVTFVKYMGSDAGIKGRITFGIYQSFLGMALGIPGLALGLMASFTDHTVTFGNENLLLANPITFLLLPVGVAFILNKEWAWNWFKIIALLHPVLMILALSLKLLPAFDQDNWMVFVFLAPVWLGNLAAVWLYGKSKPQKFTGIG